LFSINVIQIDPPCVTNGKIPFCFYGWVIFHCMCVCVCTKISPSTSTWVISTSWLWWIWLKWTQKSRYFFKDTDFLCFGYIFRTGLLGCMVVLVTVFSMKHHIALHKGCINLHSYQQCTGLLFLHILANACYLVLFSS
jgi:hypothetical protein